MNRVCMRDLSKMTDSLESFIKKTWKLNEFELVSQLT